MMRNRSSSVKGSAAPANPGLKSPGRAANPLDAAVARDPRFSVLFGLWLVGRSIVDLLDTKLAPSGLSADEFPVYCIIDIAGPLTAATLGDWMAAPPTTVSAFLRRLELRGHVIRRPNPADGRSSLIDLTDAGREAQGRAIALYAPIDERLTRQVGKRAEQFRSELLDLRAAIDSLRSDR